MTARRTTKRTTVFEGWQPDSAGRAFAANLGVPDAEIGAFVDHHLAAGNLMASWPAAWRTWCRNAVRFGTATGQPTPPPLLLISGKDDPWGALAWSHTLRDVVADTREGRAIYTIGGYDVVETARSVCAAAGWEPTMRPDLWEIAAALRDGCDPDQMVDVVRTSRRPERATLRYYAPAWRSRRASAA